MKDKKKTKEMFNKATMLDKRLGKLVADNTAEKAYNFLKKEKLRY